MHISRIQHIATRLVLFCFLAGGVLGPVMHQVKHGLEAGFQDATSAHLSHEHPDYDAISDESRHLHESDFTCVLCTITIMAAERLSETFGIPDAASISLGTNHSILPSQPSRLAIRGPPTVG